ncbi:MAG: hypothetical protein HY922_09970 [Elusimicrobia bacterium]|nr:hypothetical protein [Elusimicrobiota bacterium]
MSPRIPKLLVAALLVFSAAAPTLAKSKKAPVKAGQGAPREDGEAAGRQPSLLEPDTQLIDVHTAGILDVGGFSSQTRFFSQGGVLEWLNFGIVHRLNIGASMNVEKLIGTVSPVQLTRPELQVKFRFYDGDRIIPAFAVGYDGQGYLYNRPDKRYNQRQPGMYLSGTQEIGLPGLQAHAGMNISDFDSNAIFAFMALSLNIQDKVTLMTEWGNINDFFDSRVNMGLKVYVTPNAYVSFAARGIGQCGEYSNGVARKAERIFQFKYTGSF